jgi:hypothetical protein
MSNSAIQLRTNGFGDALTERGSAGLVAPGVARSLLGEHAHDRGDFRIARHRDLEFECSGVHDYTEIRLKR